MNLRIELWLLLPLWLCLGGCQRSQRESTASSLSGTEIVARLSDSTARPPAEAVAFEEPSVAIVEFCSDCHALPKARTFERDVWYEEIRLGYEFYARSGRTDLSPPPLADVLRFYRSQAPQQIVFPARAELDPVWSARFTPTKLDWKDAGYITPGISSIAWVELMETGVSHLLVTDMRDGTISLVDPDPARTTRRIIGRVGSPARVTPVDFDADGLQDLLVSDLGSVKPFDHTLGKVVWLRRQADSLDFESITLCDQMGRVADCAVGNFRGDQKLDLVVAEFGHRRGGSIRMMTNLTEHIASPKFSQQVLDIRPGAIRLPVFDWNADGKLDFAAIVSQEYESIEIFLDQGTKFDMHTIFTANDLAFGSIGLEIVDLDQDGDMDLLHVNGDCFDNNYANLSHGLAWHENLGNLQFEYHRVVEMPGLYRALAGDMDGDGDLDIVAVANLPSQVKPISLRESEPVSILLLEQTESLTFVSHVLETGTARYPALEVADFNADGKLDFAVGAQLFDSDMPGTAAAKLPRLTVWWQN